MALATCFVFLSENGFLPEKSLDVDAWVNLTLAVAAGLLSREETTATLRKLCLVEKADFVFPPS